VRDWIAEASRGALPRQPEVVRALRADRELFLQIRLGRIEGAQQPELVAVLSDATELKTLEAQFVQSQKMQAIGQLAGGVAHDFNNLLTAISGHCDLLLLKHQTTDPDYADLIQISQNANRAAALVSQLLAFSRKQNLQPQILSLRDVLADHAHLLNRLTGEKIDLAVETAEDLPPIRADRRQFEQVMMNLVVNARDAMPQGGCVTIGTENTTLGSDSIPPSGLHEGRYVVLTVSDTGVGMSREVQNRMFEPFFTTKEVGKGTGLGLASVYGIVQQSGGTIRVESELGRGTTFRIYLPRVEPTRTALPTEKSPPSVRARAVGGTTVLVVEDDVPLRRVTGRILRHQGYNVLEAGDVEHAKRLFAESGKDIDLLLTDVVMPRLSGPELARELSAERPSLRVLFVSGYAGTGMTPEESALVAKTHLDKPFTAGALLEKIRSVLEEG
jgi:two-component system cell cycle sensor histidine kinase/response regulator CckA